MNTGLTEDEAASIIQTKYREYHSHKLAESQFSLSSEVNQTALNELNDDHSLNELNDEQTLIELNEDQTLKDLNDEQVTDLNELNDDHVTEVNEREEYAARCIQRSYRKHLSEQNKVNGEHLSEQEHSPIASPEPIPDDEPNSPEPTSDEPTPDGELNSPEPIPDGEPNSPEPIPDGEPNSPEPIPDGGPNSLISENELLVDEMGDLLLYTDEVEGGAASTIQYHYRQYKARMVILKKQQEQAVNVIEKNYLHYKQIKEKRKIQEDEQNNAAIKIQRQFRNHQKKNHDIINIQPAIPSHEEKENAAVTIQRKFRQHQKKNEQLETNSKNKEQLENNSKISPKLKSLEMRKQERKKLKNNNKIQSDTIQLKKLTSTPVNPLKKLTSSPIKKVKKTRDIEDLVPREELLEKRLEVPESEDEPELADLCDTSTAEVVNCTSSSDGMLKTESHGSSPFNPHLNVPLNISLSPPLNGARSPPLQDDYYQAEDVQMITVHGDHTSIHSDYDSYSEEESTPSQKAQTTLVTTFVPGTLDGYAVRNLLKKTLPPPSRQKKAPDSYLQQFLKKIDSPKKGPFRTGRTPKPQALRTKEQQNNQGYHKNFDNLTSRPLPNLGKIAGYTRDTRHVSCNNRYRHHGYKPIDENHGLAKGITRGGYYPVIPAYGRLKENEVRKQKNTELQEIPWPTDG